MTGILDKSKFRRKIIQKLNALPQAQNILHHFIDGWILFQRNSFDHFDEFGDPFVSQIFLIEISSGRYIHRSQGQKVDQGATQDLDVLTAKLTHVLLNTKPCSGFPIEKDVKYSNQLIMLDYPVKRHVSKECHFFCEAPQIKEEPGLEGLKTCSPCQEAWQDAISKNIQETFEHDDFAQDPLEDSNNVMDYVQAIIKADDDSITPSFGFNFEEINVDEANELKFDQSMPSKPLDNPEDEELDPPLQSKSAISENEEADMRGKQFTCKCCSQSFGSLAKLVRHRRIRKKNKRSQRKVGCLECGNNDIITFKQLADHVAKEHPEKCEEYDQFMPQEQDTSIMKEPLKCVVCDFMNNGIVLNCRHRELYHEVGDHRCEECQQPNVTYYDLMIHNYQKHRRPTKYLSPDPCGLEKITLSDGKIQFKKTSVFKCPLCSKEYKQDCGLVTHMRCQHSWGILWCDPCGESCHYAKDLTIHVLQFHDDDPNIKCPNCFQEFDLKEDPEVFNNHFQTCFHLSKNESRQSIPIGRFSGLFQCHICGRTFTIKRNLEAHVNAHEGIFRFKCSDCGFGTNQKCIFMDHERTHAVKRARENGDGKDLSHQCEQCGKHLSTANILKRHIQVVHEGKKRVIKCIKCGENFKHVAALYKHKKQIHGIVPKPKQVKYEV